MTAASQPEVHDHPAPPAPSMGIVRELDERRAANSLAILERQADLAQLTDTEFERRLEQAKKGLVRMQEVFQSLMVEGVHYGTKDRNGNNVFKEPDLTQAGGELLRSLFRLTPSRVGEPVVTATAEFCEVRVTIALFDMAGRRVAERTGVCNSAEARFYERPRSKGRQDQAAAPIGEDEDAPVEAPDVQQVKADRRGKPLYTDARETLHVCSAIAKDKARQAIAAKIGTQQAEGRRPWSEEEKQRILAAAKRAGIQRQGTVRHVIMEVLGYNPPFTGDDVTRVLARLATWTADDVRKLETAEQALKDAQGTYGEPEQPKPAEAAAPQPPVEQGDAAEPTAQADLALDQQLAQEERRKR
jgi:hypothetical protein